MKHFSVNLLWKDFLQKYESSSCHHDAYLHLTDRTQKHDAGVNSHSTTAFAQGNAAQSRHGVRGKDTGQGGRGHGSEKNKSVPERHAFAKNLSPAFRGRRRPVRGHVLK